jgi:hypothetical protein
MDHLRRIIAGREPAHRRPVDVEKGALVARAHLPYRQAHPDPLPRRAAGTSFSAARALYRLHHPIAPASIE